MRKFLLSLIVCSGISALSGQTIFPGLEGQQLLDALAQEYKTTTVLSLADAKDTIYSVIDNHQDSVSGIYTDFTLFVQPGEDPSQWVFQGGNGINLEHSWPQSKGAQEGTQGHSDMHHLYPTRVAVNSARASFPFAEIPDPSTDTWYFLDMAMSNTPSSNINAYSEKDEAAFEPRESVKGDIARAQLYFYTMYQNAADNSDPVFFESQRLTLLQWHTDDPADAAEKQRSTLVAGYQDGKENPYVLDATLALRAFCPEGDCVTTSTFNPVHSALNILGYFSGCNLVTVCEDSVSPDRVRLISLDGRVLADVGFAHNISGFCHLAESIVIVEYSGTSIGIPFRASKLLLR